MTVSSAPQVVLKPDPSIELNLNEERVLQHLFADCHHLVIEREFQGGFGHAKVFLVTPWRDGQLARLAVKIGPSEIILDEKERYEQHIRDRLQLIQANLERFTNQGDLSAIAYQYVGDTALGDETCALRDYYRKHDSQQILSVLEHLLVRTLGNSLYRGGPDLHKPQNFEDYYSRYFPHNLVIAPDQVNQNKPITYSPAYESFSANTSLQKLRQIAPEQTVLLTDFWIERQIGIKLDLIDDRARFRVRVDLSEFRLVAPLDPDQPVSVRGRVTGRRQETLEDIAAIIFTGIPEVDLLPVAKIINLTGKTYPNPLASFQTYLDQHFEHKLSLIHGDLHMFNIIVDGFDHPWLIDFGRVREGHTLFDFIELETHLRSAVLSYIPFSVADLVDFERRLLCTATQAEPPSPPSKQDLAKAFEVILGIRRFAARHLTRHNDFSSEYFPALLLYSLCSIKYYAYDGYRAARHAFITATIQNAYLQDQLDCKDLASLAEPGFELYIYYLKKAVDDTPAQLSKRQQTFITELQKASDTIRSWLGLSAESVSWSKTNPVGLRQMVQRYMSGEWRGQVDQPQLRLAAYELNDTYIMRLIGYRTGKNHEPNSLPTLFQQLPWHPDINLTEYLGQFLYHTAHSTVTDSNLAKTVFNASLVWHTTLTCGELYCLPKSETTYLLLYTKKQEPLAGEFFKRLAPQLGWYICKANRQQTQYEAHLRPLIKEMAAAISTARLEIQALHRHLPASKQNQDILGEFYEQLRIFESLIFDFDTLLTMAKDVLNTTRINVKNYSIATEPGTFLAKEVQNEVFREQRRFLEVLPRQMETDLGRWHEKSEQARRTLDILNLAAQRYSFANQTQIRPSRSSRNQGPITTIQEPILFASNQFEVNATLMFDDIVESTAYVVRHGNPRWLLLLQRHDELLHPVIARYQGRVIKGTGDGSFSIFASAEGAMEAAKEIQKKLFDHNRKADSLNRLPIRLGLHTGHVFILPNDVFGLAVHIAARVCNIAHAGEIVMSDSTYNKAGASAADFEQIGPQNLKGLTNPVILYRKTFQQ